MLLKLQAGFIQCELKIDPLPRYIPHSQLTYMIDQWLINVAPLEGKRGATVHIVVATDGHSHQFLIALYSMLMNPHFVGTVRYQGPLRVARIPWQLGDNQAQA
ncbi:hypothetical protein D3C76_1279420 [compost metagenome]